MMKKLSIALGGVVLAALAAVALHGRQTAESPSCCPYAEEAAYVADLSVFLYRQQRYRLRIGAANSASDWSELNLSPDPEDWPILYVATAGNPELPAYLESARGALKRCLDEAHPIR